MTQFTSTHSRWAALQSRNPAAANAFIYSVKTTKIYCRPTCPSRLARRANIVFHNNHFEAEADGFRACKRCHPQTMENYGDAQKMAVDKACKLLKEDGENMAKVSLKNLAAAVGLTECHFCRVFKKIMGVTVGEYKRGLANTQHVQCEKGSLLGVTKAPRTIESNIQVMAEGELDLDLIWDDFTNASYASNPLLECTQYQDEKLIYAADITNSEDIFDFVDFGQSSG